MVSSEITTKDFLVVGDNVVVVVVGVVRTTWSGGDDEDTNAGGMVISGIKYDMELPVGYLYAD